MPAGLMTGADLGDVISNNQTDIVDVDPREVFARGHILRAVNIPLDEIEARALHELSPNRDLVVYCGFRPKCSPGSSSETLPYYCPATNDGGDSYCNLAMGEFWSLGFTRLHLMSDDIESLAGENVTIRGNMGR